MIALIALFACSGPESTATTMEHARFGWEFFNHRISRLELGVGDTEAYAVIVGGTSTTNVLTELDDGCDPDTCDEFPFFDNAEVVVGWARVTSTDAVFGTGSVDLVADGDGETTSVTIELPHRAKGEPTAIVRGFGFDADRPLAGDPACYQPKNGWLPKSLGVELGPPVLSDDGMSVTLDVTAQFEAGPTHEDARACLDAVVDRARIGSRVDVLVIVTPNDAETIPVDHSLAYAYSGSPTSPGEQPDPDWAERSLGTGLDDPLVGWSRFAFTFHEQGESRGAYIRTLDLHASAVEDIASGHATSFSPGTQLSAFDYVFEGDVQAVDVGGEIERGELTHTIPVADEPEGVIWAL